MFYKKINLILLSFYCLLVGSSNCNQVPIASISDNKDKLQNTQEAVNPPTLALDSCRGLGSISCMGGAKTHFLVQYKGRIANIDPQVEGQLAFIGLADGAALSTKVSSIIKSTIDAKDQVEKLLWQAEGDFIYWHKLAKVGTGTKEWIISVEEDVYKKLTSNKYAMHMLYIQHGASVQDYAASTTPVQMDATDTDQLLPNYQNINLEAISPIEEQTSNGTSWFLKGKIADAYVKEDAKIGFILVRDTVNPYHLVQQVIASEDGWPTLTTLFNDEMIIVPGTLREMDPSIVGDLSNSETPIQGGNFKIFCYLIQNQHYYLSQMEHIMADVTENSLSQESVPPSITFTGDNHSLKVLDLSILREKVSGQVQNVTFADFKVEYFVNDQAASLPAHLKTSLLFLQKGIIWRTATIESLFKTLDGSNRNATVTDDGTMCLVADANRPLDKSCIDFFSRAADYEYFAYLFSTETHKLTFCTQKEAITIEERQKAEPPQEDASNSNQLSVQAIHITLGNEEANITLHTPLFSKNYATYTLPTVRLGQLDKNELNHRGFLIAKAEALNNTKMDDHSPVIDEFIKNKINDKNKEISYDNKFLIFQEDLTQTKQFRELLYTVYKDKQNYQSLVISYWAQYKDKIIWSNPVSIIIK